MHSPVLISDKVKAAIAVFALVAGSTIDCNTTPANAQAQPPAQNGPAHVTITTLRTCRVYEDDSYVCGTYRVITYPFSTSLNHMDVDPTFPTVSGCIPGGVCDTPYTNDCPLDVEDVDCWNATHTTNPTP